MRPTAYLLTLMLGVAATGAQAEEIAGQREGDALIYRVGDFDSVGLGTSATVDVRVGPSWSVRVNGPAEAVARLKIDREGRALSIRPRNNWRNNRSAADQQVRVSITMPRLASASIGGSGRMTVDRVTGESLRASVGGSGSLSLGTVAVGDLAVSIGGSGDISAAGRAERLTVRNSGSGRFAAPDLRARSATVSAAGSGRVRALVDGPATVSLAGSGVVELGKGARCTVRRAGSGRAICGG
ncbi:Putative auto-transporter adhesin, head GIN domain [Sphingomonas sp. OV641]|uniref:GIN domain-containing protein n=1 Tax=Sphingomonas sp. OV641 TaxID=1881068 RepID=UPI0008C5FF1A|nr:DUF2807 domain-containing protein [Sphingomonas sp. OV641]SEJ35032.1 Putative auto-transporter adhesin, head GIN domain [Sphingomonas sp. OV641]